MPDHMSSIGDRSHPLLNHGNSFKFKEVRNFFVNFDVLELARFNKNLYIIFKSYIFIN